MPLDRHSPTCSACAKPCKGRTFRAQNVIDGSLGLFARCDRCGTLRAVEDVDHGDLYQHRTSSNFPAPDVPILIELKQRYLQLTVRSILASAPLQTRILDFGCGGGELANAIGRSGFPNVYACDLQVLRPPTLSAAVTYFCTDGIETGSLFDLIFMRHVLEHIEDPFTLLLKLQQRLTRTGRVVIEVPNVGSVFRTLLGRRWPGYFVPYHLHVFSEHGLSTVARRSGFDIHDITPCNPPIFGSYLSLLGIRRSVARFLSILLYPAQIAINRIARRPEAIRVILRRR